MKKFLWILGLAALSGFSAYASDRGIDQGQFDVAEHMLSWGSQNNNRGGFKYLNEH